ncbi:probably inactive leucine-rich repeat receptor-like protein kinase At5g48380 [Impatiens glandulifera]|uniref:probably inactive leucine-rich repeat receptor-like protein kinase At5g48380 n=1 Tax=Impatiens glandulifera TaxID=253017 RepID=UPI001FB1320A|nr:probably inactive leucine-rich repeat receptor-like protein kinase At5g48380 [Impatiens glandulifera]
MYPILPSFLLNSIAHPHLFTAKRSPFSYNNDTIQEQQACTFLLLNNQLGYGTQSDIDCLRSIKASLEDPLSILASWDFQNMTDEGFICKFIGIDCWHANENRVLNIRLSEMELKGEFPRGLANCTALTGLDLSSNKIYGHIPYDISTILSFVTSLDLSFNNFSGSIPESLGNCLFLNNLNLSNNGLSGQIPSQLGSLSRMRNFCLANNFLSGRVPNITSATRKSYENNSGLCGVPLQRCRLTPSKSVKVGI